MELSAPSTPGTYYYGACVDAVAEESDTTNNCSSSVTITVAGSGRDLVVTAFSVSDTNPIAGSTFTLSATVRNNGDSARGDVLLSYRFRRAGYGSQTTATTRLAVLAASESIDDSVVVRVPSAGSYEYAAWVRDHSTSPGHSSKWIPVTVAEPGPDPESDPEPACCPRLGGDQVLK